MAQTFYTYELYSSKYPEIPIYIGKGSGNRMNIHIKSAINQNHKNLYLQRKILKIIKEGNSIITRKILDNVSEDIAFAKEKELIAHYKSIGIKLCNLTEGGEGISGAKKSEECKKRIAAGHVGIIPWNKGKHNIYSESTLKKMYENNIGSKNPMYGKHPSEETKKKMGRSQNGDLNPMYGKHPSEETKKKMRDSAILHWKKIKGEL